MPSLGDRVTIVADSGGIVRGVIVDNKCDEPIRHLTPELKQEIQEWLTELLKESTGELLNAGLKY